MEGRKWKEENEDRDASLKLVRKKRNNIEAWAMLGMRPIFQAPVLAQ